MARRDPIDRLSESGGETMVVRAVQTGVVLGKHGARIVGKRLRGDTWPRAGAVGLREAFEELGPTYVKLGQLIASSPGLFPAVLAEEFRACLDDVPPVAPDAVLRIVEDELGEPVERLYAHFDPVPFASASIGQAHHATLPDGTEVVVKVQRPNIRGRVEGDLRVLRRVAATLEAQSQRWRMANPRAIVDDFAQNLNDDLNFIVGARSMETFADNLRRSGRAGVRTPAVLWRWTSPRVLTMERIVGNDLDDLDVLAARGIDLEAVLRTIVAVCMEAVLVHGFFHGDIHAGNLMVDDAGDVVLLDFGIVGRIDERTRTLLRSGLPSLFITKDYRAMATMLGELGSGIPEDGLDAATADLRAVLEPALAKPLSELSYASVLLDLVDVGTRHHAKLPRSLVLVGKQFLYVERYAKAMAPGWSMLADPQVLALLQPGPASPEVTKPR